MVQKPWLKDFSPSYSYVELLVAITIEVDQYTLIYIKIRFNLVIILSNAKQWSTNTSYVLQWWHYVLFDLKQKNDDQIQLGHPLSIQGINQFVLFSCLKFTYFASAMIQTSIKHPTYSYQGMLQSWVCHFCSCNYMVLLCLK